MAKTSYTTFDSISLKDIEAEADLIPLMTSEDEEALNNEALPDSIPILPLKNTVLFPGVVIPSMRNESFMKPLMSTTRQFN